MGRSPPSNSIATKCGLWVSFHDIINYARFPLYYPNSFWGGETPKIACSHWLDDRWPLQSSELWCDLNTWCRSCTSVTLWRFRLLWSGTIRYIATIICSHPLGSRRLIPTCRINAPGNTFSKTLMDGRTEVPVNVSSALSAYLIYASMAVRQITTTWLISVQVYSLWKNSLDVLG